MLNFIKNIPVLGFIARWAYNILRINHTKFIVYKHDKTLNQQTKDLYEMQKVLEIVQIRNSDLRDVIQNLNAKIYELEASLNRRDEDVKTLLHHNHIHHENFKGLHAKLDLEINNKISSHIVILNENINSILNNSSAFATKSLDIVQTQTLNLLLDDYYYQFEEIFRGSRTVIKSRYQDYLTFINHDVKDAIDIGCGRGEWVEILQQNSINAIGIDINKTMLSAGIQNGVKNLYYADVFDYFMQCDDNSFDLITAFHIIEHIPFDKLMLFLQEIKRIARDGATILLETPNPKNLQVATYNFYKDPTHLNPLPDDIVQFTLSYLGFCNIKVHYMHPYPQYENIDSSTKESEVLNSLLFCEQDYLIVANKASTFENISNIEKKHKLAMITPMPTIKSGISKYSLDLIEGLFHYYDIELILSDNNINLLDSKAINIPFRTVEWFRHKYNGYDRVLYHMGNSMYHQYMLELLATFKGVVVLHDFYLSGLMYNSDNLSDDMLYNLHGLQPLYLKNLYSKSYIEKLYPCNKFILNDAKGIVTHSNYTDKLIDEFYFNVKYKLCNVNMLVNNKLESFSNNNLLNFSKDDFIVCSFGIISDFKMSLEIVKAWQNTYLAKQNNCYLVFVGECIDKEYEEILLNYTHNSRIIITGWIERELYNCYLLRANMALQLRKNSRGETSLSLFECMEYGIPTITNKYATSSDLEEDIIYFIDTTEQDNLINAIETLHVNSNLRESISIKSKLFINKECSINKIASEYHTYIENIYNEDNTNFFNQRQIFIDISAIVDFDLNTGIQRVIKAQLIELIKNCPKNCRIEPIYLKKIDNQYKFFYALKYISILLKADIRAEDIPIEVYPNDIYYCVDLSYEKLNVAITHNLFHIFKSNNVKLYFTIYDLIPITHPQFFPNTIKEEHANWLNNVLSLADGCICISQTVQNKLLNLILENKIQCTSNIHYSYLGSNLDYMISHEKFEKNSQKISFLMVGTIEPRKGHYQTLKAFELLWNEGYNIDLVIIGKAGWMQDEFINSLNNHYKLGSNLFYLGQVSDSDLVQYYISSTALIMSSFEEGFGLPIVEAAQLNLPVIARDIPIFREVSNNSAYFFKNTNDEYELSLDIKNWISLYEVAKHPLPNAIYKLTWNDNALNVLSILQELK